MDDIDDIEGRYSEMTQAELKKLAFALKQPKQNDDVNKSVSVRRLFDVVTHQGTIVRYDLEPENDIEIVFIELKNGDVVTNITHIYEIKG